MLNDIKKLKEIFINQQINNDYNEIRLILQVIWDVYRVFWWIILRCTNNVGFRGGGPMVSPERRKKYLENKKSLAFLIAGS